MNAATRILVAIAGLLAAVAGVGAGNGLSGGSRSADSRVAAELRQGGLVVVLRHADADMSAPAGQGCAGQANVTGEGRADSLAIRRGLVRVGVVTASVLVSPLCRARETARLVLPRAVEEVRTFLVRTAADGVAAWHRKIREVRRLLGMKQRPGTDRVVVTHSEVISAVTGEDLAEGEALVLRPLGGGRFKVIDRLAPDDWNRLAAVGSTSR